MAYGEVMPPPPQTILQSEIPERLVKPRVSKWSAVTAHTRALHENDQIRETHALVFGPDDGVDPGTHTRAAQAIRTVAAEMGYQISVKWDADTERLYARCIGRRAMAGIAAEAMVKAGL